ncbi:hypothetical protein BD769DRAFT_1020010 [Suillus cothurnatus]|nr:hypothetical protein BD769DRAFT_1020010 [Suillus cothurnatus]
MHVHNLSISLQLTLHVIFAGPSNTYPPIVNVNCLETSNSLTRTFAPLRQIQVLNTSNGAHIPCRESHVISNAQSSLWEWRKSLVMDIQNCLSLYHCRH